MTYTYDANGNLTADGARTYAYDAADRLISLTQSGNTSTYAYNGQGDRVSQTVSGVTTRYTLDLASLYTQVLADGSTSYLYGLGRIGEQQTGGWAYHLTDALGSVRQLTTSAGAVSLARRFDPYGAPLTTAGSGSSIYGFTGEQTDPSGNVFLRARYYVPGMGRFLTRDTWASDFAQPLTLNRWAYAGGDPVNRTDPSGHCYGPLRALRGLPGEDVMCANYDMAIGIARSSQTSVSDKALAYGYMTAYQFGHITLAAGLALGAIATGEALLPGMSSAYLVAGQRIGAAFVRWPILGMGLSALAVYGELCTLFQAFSGDVDAAGFLYSGLQLSNGYSATLDLLYRINTVIYPRPQALGIVPSMGESADEVGSVQRLDLSEQTAAFEEWLRNAQAYQTAKGRASLFDYWANTLSEGLDIGDEIFVYIKGGQNRNSGSRIAIGHHASRGLVDENQCLQPGSTRGDSRNGNQLHCARRQWG